MSSLLPSLLQRGWGQAVHFQGMLLVLGDHSLTFQHHDTDWQSVLSHVPLE